MEIVPVSDGRGLDRFIAFPYDHYRDDPLWVPQLRRDMRTLLTPGKNPFFEHAEAQYWTARRADGRTVGRIGAIKNDMHNKEHNDRVGFYGFFESIDDQAVANALFDTAAAWLRTKGFDTMRGPMSPSVNDECGLLIANNGTPPSLMMPYNFPYYQALHERYGFAKAKDLLAFDGGGAQMAPERFVFLSVILASYNVQAPGEFGRGKLQRLSRGPLPAAHTAGSLYFHGTAEEGGVLLSSRGDRLYLPCGSVLRAPSLEGRQRIEGDAWMDAGSRTSGRVRICVSERPIAEVDLPAAPFWVFRWLPESLYRILSRVTRRGIRFSAEFEASSGDGTGSRSNGSQPINIPSSTTAVNAPQCAS